MRFRWLVLLMLPVFAPATSVAGEPAREAATLVVRIRSLDALLENLRLVVKLVDQENAVNQIEGLIKSRIGKKGLEGVDPTRPFGAYVRYGKEIDDIKGAVLIPIADPDAFLAMLTQQNVEFTKDKDGIYTHKTNTSFPLHFRFANKYLYVTSVSADSIRDKNIPDPTKALAAGNDPLIALVARLDQIPDGAKLIVLAELEKTIEVAQRRRPGESMAQEEFRLALVREVHKLGSSLIRDIAELRADLDVDVKTKELMVNVTIAGKPGSDLAKTIQAVGGQQSTLMGAAKKDAAFRGTLHLAWPDALNRAFAGVVDEVALKSIDGIRDEVKKKQAQALFKALSPTAKAGGLQVVAAALGPKDGLYTFVAALQLKDGAQLGKTVTGLITEALKEVPPELRDKIRLDADRIGAINIHQFELPKDAALDKLLAGAVGDNQLYLAFRDDALFLAIGKDALPAIKSAITQTGRVASPPLVFDFDAARMAPLMAQTPEQKDLAARLFAGGEPARVRLTIDGGATLRASLQMRLSVVEFLVKMNK